MSRTTERVRLTRACRGDPVQRSTEILNQIANDHHSGSTSLTGLAIEALRAWVLEASALDLKSARASLQETAHALARAQPAMAAIFNLANRTLWGIEETRTAEELRECIEHIAQVWRYTMQRRFRALLKHAAALIPDRGRVVTLSYSSAVLEALKAAHAKGRRFLVYCAESRPRCEGVELARQLAEGGIPCELVIDAAAPARVDDADLVLVGADGVTPTGLINKTGTYALALAARWQRVRCIALATTEKFFPPDAPIQLPLMDPAEIFPPALPNLRVINAYFEVTPLALLTSVMTEDGPADRRAMARMTRMVRTHPRLQKLV
jgi:translation initiation factor 2B subunit (eIF-2B alpha/beta/delta family)